MPPAVYPPAAVQQAPLTSSQHPYGRAPRSSAPATEPAPLPCRTAAPPLRAQQGLTTQRNRLVKAACPKGAPCGVTKGSFGVTMKQYENLGACRGCPHR